MTKWLLRLYVFGLFLSVLVGVCGGFYLYFEYGPQKALEMALEHIK